MIVEIQTYRPEFSEELRETFGNLFGGECLDGIVSGNHSETVCAFTDGEMIGFFVLRPYCREDPERFSHMARLELAVKEDSRGCGVGRKLVRLAVSRARERGLASVLVFDLPADDRIAAELLASEGFRRVGRIDGGMFQAGKFKNSLLFQLAIENKKVGK